MSLLSNLGLHVKRASQYGGQLAVRLGLLVALAGLLAGLYLLEASQMSTTGRRLEAMREQRDQLRRENAELLFKIAQDANIVRLQQRSASLGFVPAERLEYLPLAALSPDAPMTAGQPGGNGE